MSSSAGHHLASALQQQQQSSGGSGSISSSSTAGNNPTRSMLSVNLEAAAMANDPLRDLFEACKTGDLVKVKKLITSQTVNARDTAGRKSTPLHFAAGKFGFMFSFLDFNSTINGVFDCCLLFNYNNCSKSQ